MDGEEWLFETYRGILEEAGPVLGQLFSQLAAPDGVPAVFHCAGGKDRTGMAAALLLSWLGVDRQTVLDDYELSNRYGFGDGLPAVIELFVQRGISRPAAEAMLSAPRWAMARALDLLDSEYGGVELYLRGAGLMTDSSLESLRAKLVSTG
jgi:protein-tyrosine phosphatase